MSNSGNKGSGVISMDTFVGKKRKEKVIPGYQIDSLSDTSVRHSANAKRFGLFPWLLGILCIFAALYGTSYLALFWLPPYEGVDMKSHLIADYGGWAFLVFQPVDPAVIEEIKRERGLPEQVTIDGSIWPTQAGSNPTPLPASQMLVSTPLATSDIFPSSPTALQSTYTLNPMQTSTISTPKPPATLGVVETPIPANVVSPAKTSKPRKTSRPHKTSKPPKDPKN